MFIDGNYGKEETEETVKEQPEIEEENYDKVVFCKPKKEIISRS